LREGASFPHVAGVAQSVEHLICNQGVGGSNPFASSRERFEQATGSGAAGFSKRTPFGIFRRVVIFAVFVREPWFPVLRKSVSRSLFAEAWFAEAWFAKLAREVSGLVCGFTVCVFGLRGGPEGWGRKRPHRPGFLHRWVSG
jgi:hypothetical protein